jgi:hypothetical protein
VKAPFKCLLLGTHVRDHATQDGDRPLLRGIGRRDLHGILDPLLPQRLDEHTPPLPLLNLIGERLVEVLQRGAQRRTAIIGC